MQRQVGCEIGWRRDRDQGWGRVEDKVEDKVEDGGVPLSKQLLWKNKGGGLASQILWWQKRAVEQQSLSSLTQEMED